MKLHLFSIHDSKAEAFIQPYFAPTIAVGVRSFQTACNDDTCQFQQNPGDYTLFELGTFDQDTCKFNILNSPKSHGLALQYKDRADRVGQVEAQPEPTPIPVTARHAEASPAEGEVATGSLPHSAVTAN